MSDRLYTPAFVDDYTQMSGCSGASAVPEPSLCGTLFSVDILRAWLPKISCGAQYISIYWAVWVWITSVTDGQTDRQNYDNDSVYLTTRAKSKDKNNTV